MIFAHLKFACALVILCSLSCTRNLPPLGSVENPIKFFLVPSVEQRTLEASGSALKTYLEKATPYHYRFSVPTSYISVVEAFGANRTDVASLNTYGYMLAYKKYGAEALLTVIRSGAATYQSQILVRADDKSIRSLEDLNGKKVAFVDPTSASGFLVPSKLFRDHHIKPSQTVFAQRHDNVISMIYQKQIDAGATYYSPPLEGKMQDARMLVLAQYPNVEKDIRILQLTDPIPNDPIVFRKNLPSEMKQKIAQALIEYVKTEEGRNALEKTFAVTGFQPTTDQAYDATRKMFEDLSQEADAMLKGK